MIRLNSKLILEPKAVRNALMSVAAALYTSQDMKTADKETARKAAELCSDLWSICEALEELEGGYGADDSDRKAS